MEALICSNRKIYVKRGMHGTTTGTEKLSSAVLCKQSPKTQFNIGKKVMLSDCDSMVSFDALQIPNVLQIF